MRQIVQHQKSGAISIKDLPTPQLPRGGILVRNAFSVISAGTERTSVETARASMLGKARSRPDLVKQVLANVRREGLLATYRKVQNRLENYKELGYSSAGIVLATSVDDFRVGDRVACAGGGHAVHAEVVSIPKNLAAKIPDGVRLEDAAYVTLGAIALQGVRQADVRLGEVVVVIGLGLLGLITVQLLKAAGCAVIGMDISNANFELATQLGCDAVTLSGESALPVVESFSGGYGADDVIITASTRSHEPLRLAQHCARKKGRIVVVGAIGMNLDRSPFYEKELELRISCSYGPGRYDHLYEEEGLDYPYGYVRWTENRNMQAFLELLAQKKAAVDRLTTHTFPLERAQEAYDMITGKSAPRYVGILLSYSNTAPEAAVSRAFSAQTPGASSGGSGEPSIGFIGAGNFAQSHLLPALKRQGARLEGVATLEPVGAQSVAEKFGFTFASTDPESILNNTSINAVFISTRHDSHARYVQAALASGKHVYVEKPLAVTRKELDGVRLAYEMILQSGAQQALFTGFNRRFSGPFGDIKRWFADRHEPLSIVYRVNAGVLPPTHWMQDPKQGGRIIGEGCHFIDTMVFLTGARPLRVAASGVESGNVLRSASEDVSAVISFSDGSVGVLTYLAGGAGNLPKEYCEVHTGGMSAVMRDFAEVEFLDGRKKIRRTYNGSKGHAEEVDHFLQLIRGKTKPLLSFEEMCEATLTTFAIMESLKLRRVVRMG